MHNFFLIIQMIPQKVLHNSNDPITSISFGADFEEEEDLEEVELIQCKYCGATFPSDSIAKHEIVLFNQLS